MAVSPVNADEDHVRHALTRILLFAFLAIILDVYLPPDGGVVALMAIELNNFPSRLVPPLLLLAAFPDCLFVGAALLDRLLAWSASSLDRDIQQKAARAGHAEAHKDPKGARLMAAGAGLLNRRKAGIRFVSLCLSVSRNILVVVVPMGLILYATYSIQPLDALREPESQKIHFGRLGGTCIVRESDSRGLSMPALARKASAAPEDPRRAYESCVFKDERGATVVGYRHLNPDGEIGGWVAQTARVGRNVFVHRSASVGPGVVLEDNERVEAGTLVYSKA